MHYPVRVPGLRAASVDQGSWGSVLVGSTMPSCSALRPPPITDNDTSNFQPTNITFPTARISLVLLYSDLEFF